MAVCLTPVALTKYEIGPVYNEFTYMQMVAPLHNVLLNASQPQQEILE